MYTKKTKIIGAMLAVIMLMQIFCTSITSVVLATEAANNVEITFVDENLYTAIKEAEEVKGKLKSYSNKDKTITISSANIATITSLDLNSMKIENLSGIEEFKSLTYLDLEDNELTNIEELGELTQLETLKLSNNHIEDCSVLESLEKLNLKNLTLGSQTLEKTIIINSEDIENNSFTYSLPQIFTYIKELKNKLGQENDLTSPGMSGGNTHLFDKIQTATVNEDNFEITVYNIAEEYQDYVSIKYVYQAGKAAETELLLNLVVVNDSNKLGIVFEDDNLYNAVKANIEGTQANGYADSKYTEIRDDNEGCVWYDDILSLVINRHYLYKDIVDLDLVNKQIENLEGLQYFVGLSDLDLSNNFISDVSVLEELGKEKANAEADFKVKVEEIYDELIKNINLKEDIMELSTPKGKSEAIRKIIGNLREDIDKLSEEEISAEQKSLLKTYFVDKLNQDTLRDTTNINNMVNGTAQVIGYESIGGNDKLPSQVYFSGNTIISTIYVTSNGTYTTSRKEIDLDYAIYSKIISRLNEIQKIKEEKLEIDGRIQTKDNAVNLIKRNIEKLENYIDIENLFLILPRETIELTEAEVENYSLDDTVKLAKNIVELFKNALPNLTAEEMNIAFGLTGAYRIDNTTELNNTIEDFTNEMNEILSCLDKNNKDKYIGEDKYKLLDIIFEYIGYQKNIIKSQSILNEIGIGYKNNILSSETVDFSESELYRLLPERLQDIASKTLEEFIAKDFEEDISNYIKDFPSKDAIEAEKVKIEEGNLSYDTVNELVTVIMKYRYYNNILSKGVMEYTREELNLLTYSTINTLAQGIIQQYIENYGLLTGLPVTEATMNSVLTNIKNSTENGGGSYDTVSELANVIITYIGYQAKIDDIYVKNFTSTYSNYNEYIKAALTEETNYIGYDDNNLDKQDIGDIIRRLTGVKSKFDEVIILPKTKVINLSSNNLTDISKLTNIPTLVELYVRDNIIRDLSLTDFTKFEKLNTLDLSHNRIYETKIGLMPNLENLNLSYNYIEKIDGMQLSAFTKLQSINLAGNRIYDLQNIMYNLHIIANYQINEKMVPIIKYSHGNAHILSNTKVEECGYIVDKAKVNFEDQTIYASVADKIMQGVDEYVKLPAIFNQVKYIDCGETNFLNAKATNDGMIMYLETSRLGEQTEVAYIQGTGVATGTKCYVTYTVATEDEVSKVLIESLDIQIEKELTDNENDTMPDIDRDGDVDGDDLARLNNTGINLTDEQMKIAKNIVPDDVYSASDRVLLKKYIEEKVEWTEKTLTAAIKAKAEVASMTGKDKPSKEDLLILTKYIMSGNTSSYTVEQLLEKLDLTGDKQLTALDAMYLTKYLAITSTEKESIETLELKMIGNYKETKQLYALITPENADPDQQEIVWRTSNQGAVTVNQQGIITAVGQGNAIITVASTKNSQVYDTIYVTVGEANDVVDSIVMTEETRNKLARDYYLGEELDLVDCKLEISRISGKTETVDIKPEMVEGFTTENVTTESIYVKVKFEGQETGFNMNVLDWPDNRTTLTKDNFDDYLNVTIPTDAEYNGPESLPEVKPDENKKLGTITVKYKDEAGNVVEKPVNAGTYKVLVDITDGVDVNAATDVEVGTFTIAKAELPEDQRPVIATEYTVEKGGSFGVTVENGTINVPEGITFDEVGTKEIKVIFTPNNANYTSVEIPVKVNVVISVTGVNINRNKTVSDIKEYTIALNGTTKLNAEVMPGERKEDGTWVSNATNKNVTWSSSNENKVKVDTAGNIEAVGIGDATITVTTEDGQKSTTYKIVVKEKVYGQSTLENETICIKGINPGTTEQEFRRLHLTDYEYKIVKKDSTRDVIATGDELIILENGTETSRQILVVKGDVDGDGKITGQDSTSIRKHNGGEKLLENEYLLAADANCDGKVNGSDSIAIILHRVGTPGFGLDRYKILEIK